MNLKTNELDASELWAMFNNERQIVDFFDADIESEGQLYYCYGEIALELASSDKGKEHLTTQLSKMSELQLAACLDGLRLNNDSSMRDIAETKLNSCDNRLRTAALDYVASFAHSEYVERLATFLTDKSDIVRATAVTWLVRGLSGDPVKLSALMAKVRQDGSEVNGTVEIRRARKTSIDRGAVF